MRNEDGFAWSLQTLDHAEFLSRARGLQIRQSVQPPVRRRRSASHASRHRADAFLELWRIVRRKEHPTLQPTEQRVPCASTRRIHVQTGARAINADDDVLVHGKESARVLREVIQVVEEIRGGAEIIEQFRPRTLQITFKYVKREIRGNFLDVFHVETQWQLDLQRPCSSIWWEYLRHLEWHVPVVLQHRLSRRPPLRRAPLFRDTENHCRTTGGRELSSKLRETHVLDIDSWKVTFVEVIRWPQHLWIQGGQITVPVLMTLDKVQLGQRLSVARVRVLFNLTTHAPTTVLLC
mmetsp:Transcript_31500/g.84022  ORF Transcript_31500/g.84022 Transcript_31500/m.84022 type:complete len:293 (+) Transcript_31500:244-1122(+)